MKPRRRLGQQLDAMLGLCETVECRCVRLLAHFGQHISACGNCDVCLDPPQAWDARWRRRKCCRPYVWKERGRYGAGIIDILRGKSTERTKARPRDAERLRRRRRPERPPGAAAAPLAQGLLTVDNEGYGTLALTEGSRGASTSSCCVANEKKGRASKDRQRAKAARGPAAGTATAVRAARLARRSGQEPRRAGLRHLPRRHAARDRAGPPRRWTRSATSAASRAQLEAYGEEILQGGPPHRLRSSTAPRRRVAARQARAHAPGSGRRRRSSGTGGRSCRTPSGTPGC